MSVWSSSFFVEEQPLASVLIDCDGSLDQLEGKPLQSFFDTFALPRRIPFYTLALEADCRFDDFDGRTILFLITEHADCREQTRDLAIDCPNLSLAGTTRMVWEREGPEEDGTELHGEFVTELIVEERALVITETFSGRYETLIGLQIHLSESQLSIGGAYAGSCHLDPPVQFSVQLSDRH